jgi:hypothetical protein
MDPVTAMATASAAFSAIKKGFQVGRDIESMTSDISRWMGALSDLDQAEREAKNPPIFKKLFAGKSVEQEALEIFAAKRKAADQREELRNWVTFTLGIKAWQDLVQTEATVRKQRKETLYRQREKRRKFIEIIAWTGFITVAIGVLGLFASILISFQAKADQYVACRLAGCDDHKGAYLCVYRGANNTMENMIFSKHDFIPKEYQCKYKPNDQRPPTIQETLKAIKEALK